MIGALAVMLLSAAPVRLAAPGFVVVNFDEKLADLYLDRFIVLAKNPDLAIVTSRDIAQVLGMERQRELMGCGTSDWIEAHAKNFGEQLVARVDSDAGSFLGPGVLRNQPGRRRLHRPAAVAGAPLHVAPLRSHSRNQL